MHSSKELDTQTDAIQQQEQSIQTRKSSISNDYQIKVGTQKNAEVNTESNVEIVDRLKADYVFDAQEEAKLLQAWQRVEAVLEQEVQASQEAFESRQNFCVLLIFCRL